LIRTYLSILFGNERKEDIMERERRTYGENKNTRFVWQKIREIDNLEDMEADRG
jgi:hypothetical protein